MQSVKWYSKQHLIIELSKRDIKERYRGSLFGVWWTLITPMTMLFVFTFVFGEIFRARWHNGDNSIIEFGLNLYAGLIVFWFFAEVIGKAPSLIYSQPNFVKKVIFPLEILSIVSLITALFHFCINAVILCIGVWLFKGQFSWSIFILPLALSACVPLLLGCSWILCSLSVYIRDIGSVIGVAINLLMFLSPIFYPLEAVPEKFQWLFKLNPITFVIEWIRNGLMMNELPQTLPFLTYCTFSACVCFLGYVCFQRLRGGFADVI